MLADTIYCFVCISSSIYYHYSLIQKYPLFVVEISVCSTVPWGIVLLACQIPLKTRIHSKEHNVETSDSSAAVLASFLVPHHLWLHKSRGTETINIIIKAKLFKVLFILFLEAIVGIVGIVVIVVSQLNDELKCLTFLDKCDHMSIL